MPPPARAAPSGRDGITYTIFPLEAFAVHASLGFEAIRNRRIRDVTIRLFAPLCDYR
jgi:hypothetical protein